MNIRSPAVAGAFYPATRAQVLGQLTKLFRYWEIDYSDLDLRKRIECKGVVVPHAGWDYSGYVAARVFADIPKVDTIAILGPNHYGIGPDFSISADDAWVTPLGEVTVDTTLAKKLASGGIAELDELAHLREHSIEVQLPFLQSVLDDFKIVPISVKHYAPDGRFLRACQDFGMELAKALPKKALLVASTDFTHYEPGQVAEKKDSLAIEQIIKLDETGLFDIIKSDNISMCGYAGVAAVLSACRRLGAKKAEKVAYMTSGDTTGDDSAVVGYGGLRVL